MKKVLFGSCLLLAAAAAGAGEAPPAQSPAVAQAMKAFIDKGEIAGAVTLVATRGGVASLDAVGLSDRAAGASMSPDSLFWIASMTKPFTATAILMLQEEGKLSVADPVGKYIPELADMKNADGTPGKLTLRHLLTHTSGMPEASPEQYRTAKTLSDLIPFYAGRPLQFKPGSKWQYCQSGINSLGRIIEIVSGQSYPDFLQQRLFDPLALKDTTFYPTPEQAKRLAKSYKLEGGQLQEAPIFMLAGRDPAARDRYAAPNGGLFSTAPDYGRFCRMILNGGSLDGKKYLSPESVKLMTSIQTGALKTGFTDGNGWGLGWCVVREPQGVTAMLSSGSFGHGGAYGTQAWIDPVKGTAYVLMVQRANFPNSDASDVRRAFQAAAAGALNRSPNP